MIYLERDDNEQATLELDAVAWWNTTTSTDSTFAEAEYRVHNPGPATVARYAVYFRISTNQNDFLAEVTGDTLEVSQSDVGRLKTYIVDRTATGVEVDDVWAEPVSD